LLDLTNKNNFFIIGSAFIYGIISNLHCVSMCGPVSCQSGQSRAQQLIYHSGRLISYQLLGFILYFSTNSIFNSYVLIFHKISFYILTILYFYMGINYLLKSKKISFSLIPKTLYQKMFYKILNTKYKTITSFLLGIISALLPCGILHFFLLSVVIIKSKFIVFLYISSFWLATTPLLLSINFIINYINKRYKVNTPKLQGSFFVLMAIVLFFMRIYVDLENNCH
jgi:uncharacterized protein